MTHNHEPNASLNIKPFKKSSHWSICIGGEHKEGGWTSTGASRVQMIPAAGSAGAACDPEDVARMVEGYVIGKKKEDASSQRPIASITTHLTALPPLQNNRHSRSIIYSLICNRLSIPGGTYRRWMHVTGSCTQGSFRDIFLEWNIL